MDLHDIWQQHKRWILGVAAGLALFWIGNVLIGTFFDSRGAETRVRAIVAGINGEALYEADARKAAQEERDRLAAQEARLRAAEEFRPSEDYVLAGKGDPDTWFDEVSRRVRGALLDRAQELGVELTDKGLRWTPPVGRAEIASTLVGLCVLEQGVLRLLAAGDAVRAQDPDALGVPSIDSFTIEKLSPSSSRVRKSKDRVDVTDRIDEYVVAFTFRADIATVQQFLDRLRAQPPVIGLAPDLSIQAGRQPGDPLLVKGRLSAITIRDP